MEEYFIAMEVGKEVCPREAVCRDHLKFGAVSVLYLLHCYLSYFVLHVSTALKTLRCFFSYINISKEKES